MFEVNHYDITSPKLKAPLRIALAADLHDKPFEYIIEAIKAAKVDIIAIPGDLVNSYASTYSVGVHFLAACAKLAPTFYSSGNHEMRIGSIPEADIDKSGAVFVDDRFVLFRDCVIGGFPTLGDIKSLDHFASQNSFKILLSHHPEHYKKHHRMRDIDLILSGHAHGGQVRIFGQGLYSPGQGILPKYTSGVHENRLVISRGLCNSRKVPRLWNNPELVIVNLIPVN